MAVMKKFFKMHGLGNDFVILDCRDGSNVSAFAAKEIANRRTGVGCDQLIILKNSHNNNDVFLEFRNNDGSKSSACGNGTRCVAEMVLEEKSQEEIKIETEAGILNAWKNKTNGFIAVDMGRPKFIWNEIPLARNIDHKKVDLGKAAPANAFCLSMGNPHAVLFLENLDGLDIANLGPKLENHPMFPEKANISFAKVISQSQIKIKIWERGVGVTMACGTGACAVVVAANELLKTDKKCEVILDGGKLNVCLSNEGNVFLEGPNEKSFNGFLGKRLSDLIN
jgi:diaminopimelate epimerase